MYLYFICFLPTYHLCYHELWIETGSCTWRRNKSLLIDSGKDRKQPREGRDPIYSVFQITEDIGLRRVKCIRTPCYSNTSLKGPWFLKILAYINSVLPVLLISHMWLITQSSPLCGWLLFLWDWLPLPTTSVKTSQHLSPSAPPPFSSPSHWAFKSLPHHSFLLPIFSLYQNHLGTSGSKTRSILKVQVMPSAIALVPSLQQQ